MSKGYAKLKQFVTYLGVNSIVECESFEDGLAENGYLFPFKIITIRNSLSNEQKLISLAHEAGHFINRLKHSFWSQYSDDAVEMIRKYPNHKIVFEIEDMGLMLSKRKFVAQELVLEEEKIAWKEAEEMLKFLKIKVPTSFQKCKRQSLNTYKQALVQSKKFKKTITIKDSKV